MNNVLSSVYESADRNLKGDLLVTELSDRTRVGRSSILTLLKSLPKTVHELDKFTVDAFQPSNSATKLEMINVSIRGAFLESDPSFRRLFHRVMLLSPSKNSYGVGITNDMLYVGDLLKVQQNYS